MSNRLYSRQPVSLPARRVLLTDLDNTLFNWIDYFAPAFRAMVHALAWATKVSEATLYDQFRDVYADTESVEYTWAIQQLALCKGLKAEEIQRLVHIGRVAFGKTLRKRLQPYPEVASTLRWLKEHAVCVAGVSNSFIADALFRLRTLGLESYFDALIGWNGFGLPANDTSLQRRQRVDRWRQRTTIPSVVTLPSDLLKPNATSYLRALEALRTTTSVEVWVVGDSINKDLVPAREIGATDVWARYGRNVDPQNMETLLTITHWSEQKVASVFDDGGFEPAAIIDGFSELRRVVPEYQGQLFLT